MTPDPKRTRYLYFKQHILPVFFVFVIPAFSAWFFGYAERSTDREVLQDLVSDVQKDPTLDDTRRPKIIAFFEANPPSVILASRKPELVRAQAMFAPMATRYGTFRWMARVAWFCLAVIAATFVIVGLSAASSFQSHAAQYRALRIGWPVLRTSAAIQVLGQAVLAVALSYWVTVFFMHSYVPKLIGIIGVLAAAAVFALWKAIFAKVDDRCRVNGEIAPESDAPRLWEHVRALAARATTAAPDQIILGIEPNFFVTEHPVSLGAQVYSGRTLYLSLPMLKVMTADEADAVLGHELAHLSGEDTLWARKISPLTGKFVLYFQTLGNGLSLLVAHFMLFFWKLYSLSIHKLGREREFRADRIGAELVSADAMKRALVKITCYCEYRSETESSILREQRVNPGLDLAGRLEGGYAGFLSSFATKPSAENERVPHPFDTHPTLHNRLAQLGFEAAPALRDAQIQQPVADSWYSAILTAPAMEQRMWTERQTMLQSVHEQELAWRLLPVGEEETAHVVKHFPHAVFLHKDGSDATLNFDRLQLPKWDGPILFKDITHLAMKNTWLGRRLTITHRPEGAPKPVKTKAYLMRFKGEKGHLLDGFSMYYNRHKTAEAASRETVA